MRKTERFQSKIILVVHHDRTKHLLKDAFDNYDDAEQMFMMKMKIGALKKNVSLQDFWRRGTRDSCEGSCQALEPAP